MFPGKYFSLELIVVATGGFQVNVFLGIGSFHLGMGIGRGLKEFIEERRAENSTRICLF